MESRVVCDNEPTFRHFCAWHFRVKHSLQDRTCFTCPYQTGREAACKCPEYKAVRPAAAT